MKNQKGFTLIEVLASVVILSMVVMIFLNISNFSLVSNRKSDQSTEAMRIAETVLNNARITVNTTGIFPGTLNLNPPVATPGYTATIQPTVSTLSNTAIAYNTSSFKQNHISLQAIVFLSTAPTLPKIMTVTVSWE